MFESYLFIPANKLKFLKGLYIYKPDFFILDIEDSVPDDKKGEAIENIKNLQNLPNNVILRLPSNLCLSSFDLDKIFHKFSTYLIPKLESEAQIEELFSELLKAGINPNSINILLSIETPLGVVEIKSLINKYKANIFGIAFGSHDYCRVMNAEYDYSSFEWARNYVLNVAKAYKLRSIDVASVLLEDKSAFINECRDGFRRGFEGKPILHPKQLNWLKEVNYYTDSELDLATKVFRTFNGVLPDELEPIMIDGKIIEKPHLEKLKILFSFVELNQKRDDT